MRSLFNQRIIYSRDEEDPIMVSFILTIHNHGFILEKVLLGILSSAKLKFEIIIIDDASKDNSFQILKKFINRCSLPSNLIQIIYRRNYFQKFEVASDNIGCKLASGEFLCLIQGDMALNDRGFDSRIVNLLNKFEIVGAISGKSVRVFGEKSINKWVKSQGHAFKLPKLPKHILLNILRKNSNSEVYKKNFNKLNKNQDNYVQIENYLRAADVDNAFIKHGEINYKVTSRGIEKAIINSGKLYVGRLINRGPIFIKRDNFIQVGGFNEKIFFQGWDDFELSTKLLLLGKVVAYSPINFLSEANWGATQRKKTVWLIILIKIKKIKRHRKRKLAAISNYSKLSLEHELFGKIL